MTEVQAKDSRFTYRKEALNYVAAAAEGNAEEQALLRLGFTTSEPEADAEDGDAEGALCNFLTPMWPGTHATDLLRVERMALYGAELLPTKNQMSDLGLVRELIGLVQAYVAAQEADLVAANRSKNLNRRKNETGRAEERLLQFAENWSELLVPALRMAEKRAAYMQQEPLSDEDLAALLLFHELTDRVERYLQEYSMGASVGRQRRTLRHPEPSTSAN